MNALRAVAAYGRDGLVLLSPNVRVKPQSGEIALKLEETGEVVVGPADHDLVQAAAAEKRADEAARLAAHQAREAEARRKKGTRRPLKRPRY